MRTRKTTITAVLAGLVLFTLGSTAGAQELYWQNGCAPDRHVFQSTGQGLKMIGAGLVLPIVTGEPELIGFVPMGLIVTPLGLIDDVGHMPETVPNTVGRIIECPQKAIIRCMQRMEYHHRHYFQHH